MLRNPRTTGLTRFTNLKPDKWTHAVVALTCANKINLAGAMDRDKVADFYCNFKAWKTRIAEFLCEKLKVKREVVEEIFFVPTGNHSVIENIMHPWRLHAECPNWFPLFWIACVASTTGPFINSI